MKLKELLARKKSKLRDKWFDVLIESYPADSSRFLHTSGNQFGNPVGHTFKSSLTIILDSLIEASESGLLDKGALLPAIDELVRIRSVQNFSPSTAIAFAFLLKSVVQEHCHREIAEEGLYEELWRFEALVDAMALMAFDSFMGSRERLYEVRVRENERMTRRLLRRAGMVVDEAEEEDGGKRQEGEGG